MSHYRVHYKVVVHGYSEPIEAESAEDANRLFYVGDWAMEHESDPYDPEVTLVEPYEDDE